VKLVIEAKTIWSLTASDNIAATYRISGNTVRHPVQQIFGQNRWARNLKFTNFSFSAKS
jgi:hypothetical protein